MNKIYLIDSGHGGMVSGEYVTAPAKMHVFSNGEIAYEGVINRVIKKRLIEMMDLHNFQCIDICPTELDLDLDLRVDYINRIVNKYGRNKCLLISLHSNAGGGTGFEIWTSIGQTKSDSYAEMLGEVLMKDFAEIYFRTDKSDGDLDKESPFYILKYSICPAILPECLFFDNWNDFKKLINPVWTDKYVDSLITFIHLADLNAV